MIYNYCEKLNSADISHTTNSSFDNEENIEQTSVTNDEELENSYERGCDHVLNLLRLLTWLKVHQHCPVN